jgi:hypothetical protein
MALARHPGAGRDPAFAFRLMWKIRIKGWIPACAGMTVR